MAVIYTYPIKAVPEGDDLILISDSKDKFTKQIKVSSISGGSGGDGCVNAISGIQTPAGTYSASLCATTSFTSTGGSISISGTAAGVNFEANCITNYVLKPVICQGSQCTASTASETWLFSCDSSLSQYAGVNIPVVLENNGSIVPHSQNPDPNDPTNCFYVELWSPTVSLASNCQSCCDLPPVELKCLYTKCSDSDPNMPTTLTLDKVNDNCTTGVIYVTETATNYSCCYTFTGEVDATVDTGYTFVTANDCAQAPCVDTPLIKTWDICPDACDTGTLPSIVYDDDIEGTGLVVLSNGISEACYTLRIPGTVANPTTGITQVSRYDTLNCDTGVTQNRCKELLFHFVKCADATCTGDSASVENIYSEQSYTASTDDVVLFEFDDRSSCCYVLQEDKVCEKVTGGINFNTATKVEALDPCASQACGEDPPLPEKWVYNSCSGCDPIVSTSRLHTPGIDFSMWWNCCYYKVPVSAIQTDLADSEIPTEEIFKSNLECESLRLFNQIEWTKCDDPSIKIYTGCCDTQDTLHLGFVAKDFSGPVGCYEITGLSKEQDTSPCDNIIETNCQDPGCGTSPPSYKFQTRNCGGTQFSNVSTDYSAFVPNADEIYTFNSTDNTCFEIQKVLGTASGPSGPTVSTGPYSDSGTGETACECCNNKDNHQYSKCEESTLAACPGLDQTIVVSIVGTPPEYIIAGDASGNCCYSFDGSTCKDITVGYSQVVGDPANCEDPLCIEPLPNDKFQAKLCSETDWTDVTGSLDNYIGVWKDTRGDCYEIRKVSGTPSGPLFDPSNLLTQFVGTPDAPACDCCENDGNQIYQKCTDTDSPLSGCASMGETIVINSAAVGSVLVRDSRGNECCYTAQGPTCDPDDGSYTIVQQVDNCNAAECNQAVTQPQLYTKCSGANSGPCLSMDRDVTIDIVGAPPTNCVIENTATGDSCCYVWVSVGDVLTPDYQFSGLLNDCEPDSLDEAGCAG